MYGSIGFGSTETRITVYSRSLPKDQTFKIKSNSFCCGIVDIGAFSSTASVESISKDIKSLVALTRNKCNSDKEIIILASTILVQKRANISLIDNGFELFQTFKNANTTNTIFLWKLMINTK